MKKAADAKYMLACCVVPGKTTTHEESSRGNLCVLACVVEFPEHPETK
jgi:hypothetical protein